MLNRFALPILAMPRRAKRVIVLSVDASLCVITVWLAYYLRLGEWVKLSGDGFWQPLWAVGGSLVVALPIFVVNGFYRAIFRYSGLTALMTMIKAIAVYGLLYATVFTAFGVNGVPRTVGLIQPMLLLLLVGASRMLARFWLGGLYRNQLKLVALPRVLIYGAGNAGRQLAAAMANSHEMRVVGFLDDDDRLHGHVLNGLSRARTRQPQPHPAGQEHHRQGRSGDRCRRLHRGGALPADSGHGPCHAHPAGTKRIRSVRNPAGA